MNVTKLNYFKLAVLINIGLFQFGLYASNDQVAMDANQIGRGLQFTTIQSVFSSWGNPSLLPHSKSLEIGVTGQFQLFQSEVSNVAVGIVKQNNTSGIGFTSRYYGNAYYNEWHSTIGYGLMIIKDLYFGGNIQYLRRYMEESDAQSAVTFGLGANYKINEQIMTGFSIQNPLAINQTDFNTDQVSSIVAFGVQYQPSEKIYVGVEFEKNTLYNSILKTGISYQFSNDVSAAIGYQANPSVLTLGFQWKMNDFLIGVSTFYHQHIGYMPSTTIIYQRNE